MDPDTRAGIIAAAIFAVAWAGTVLTVMLTS